MRIVVVLSLALAGCIPVPLPSGSAPAPAANVSRSDGGQPQQILNGYRDEAGRVLLQRSERLDRAAQIQAQYLSQIGRMTHTGADGGNSATRIRSVGCPPLGENLAEGYPTISRVMAEWMASSGHRENMLASRARHFGLARSGNFWVMTTSPNCP